MNKAEMMHRFEDDLGSTAAAKRAMSDKSCYDRHRRIKKRINLGGRWLHGCWLPDKHVTWGELLAAKIWAKKYEVLFERINSAPI